MMILTSLLAISSTVAAALALKVRTLQKEQERLRNLTNEDSKVLFLKSRYASMGETLGNIAHQWKQPLNAIGTIQNSIKASLIFNGEISKDKLLNSVDTSFKLLQHLAETIDTFYSFLAQSGDATTRFYLADELEKVRKITEYSFENSNINLVFELEINPSIQGNANELTHALLNLILNAKDAFDTLSTANPTITVRVVGHEDTCTITITDNAGGIRVKPIEMVFDLHITTKEDGSGLGLFMTKNIIENRFGGKIAVKNTKNGACFTIELPYAEYNEQYDSLSRDEKLTLDRINQLSQKVIELEEIEKNLRKWSEIFKKAHWAIALHIGTSNRFDLTNDAFNALYGYTPEEMRQLSVPDLFTPESLPILSEVQHIAFEKGYVAFESVHKRRDGSIFPVSVELMVIKDNDGEILYHMANIWDLSEKKAAEERLLLKKFALDHIRDAVFLIDAHARFHYVNDGACNALGYTREELLMMDIGDVDPDWPRERWPEHWEALKVSGSMTMELRHRRKDGTIFPVEVSANYIEYNGHFYNMAVARDITERKAAEEALQTTLTKLTNFASAFPGVMYTYHIDPYGNATMPYTSERLYELFGIENHLLQLDGNYVMNNLVHPDDKERMSKKVAESKTNLTLWHDEFRIIHPTKGIRWMEGQGLPQRLEDGGTMSYGVLFDITARKETERSFEIVKMAIELSSDGAYLGDIEGNILWVNDGACMALGYTREELMSLNITDIDPEFPGNITPEILERFAKTNSNTMITHHKRKDGSMFPVEINTNLVEFDGIQLGMSIARDITERKAAEEQLLLQNFALDTINEAVYLIDENSMFHYVNDGACKALGYTKEELLTIGVINIDPNCTREWWSEHWKTLKKQNTFTIQSTHKRKDGTVFPIEVSINYFEYAGIGYNLAITRDITERLALEAEKETRTLKTVAENSPDVIIRYDLEGRRTYANPKAKELLNIEIGKSPTDKTPIIDKELYVSELKKVIETGVEATFEITYINVVGGIDYSHIRMVPEFGDDSGNITSVLMIGRNITEYKQTLNALETKERELRALAESSPGMMGAYHMRPDGSVCMPYASSNIYDLFGITAEEIKNDATALMALTHPDDAEMVVQTIQASAQNMSLWHLEYRIIHSTKGIRWMEGNTMPYPHPDGGVVWYGYVHDITERKAMEASVKEANDRYIQILDNNTDVIYLIEVTPEGKYVYVDVNAAYEEVTGIPRESVIGLCVDDIDNEAFRTILIDKFDWCINVGVDTEYTAEYPFPSGIRTFHSLLTPIRDKSGRISRIVGSARDITEHKALEEQIRQSEQNLKNAQKIAKLGSWHLDIQNERLTWSDETYRMFELDPLGVTDLHQTFYEHVHPEDRERVRGLYVESLYAKTSYELDHRIVMSDGRIKYVIERCEHVYAPDGTPLFSNGTVLDITERKLIEQELENSHRFLNDLIDAIPDPIFVKNREHTWTLLNQAFCDLSGLSKEALLGKSDYDVFPQEEADIFWEKDELVFDSGKTNINEESFTSTDGITHHIQTIKATFISNDDHQYLVGTIRDLSERKAMEDNLRQALEFNEGIIGAIPDLLFEVTPDGTYVGIWAQDEELLVAQKEMLLGNNFKDFFPPMTVILLIQTLKEVDEKGHSLGKTFSFDFPEGKRWFELSASKKKSSGNYIILSRDITERKHAENALQTNRNLLHAILESSPGVITFALDTNYCYIAFDSKHVEVMRTIFGKEIALGMNMLEVITVDTDREIAKRSFDRALGGENFIAEEDYGDERLSRNYWQIFYSPIRSTAGEIIGLTCFNMDITERKKAEEEIKALNDTLEKRVAERTEQLEVMIGKLHHEINERIKTEMELKEREEKFYELFKLSPAAISITSLERNMYLEVNKSFLDNTGLSREEVIGHSSADLNIFVYPEERAELFRRINETGIVNDFRYHFRSKNGEVGYAAAYGSIISYRGERCYIGHSYDMSAYKDMEEMRQERLALEEQLSKLAASVPGVNYIFERTAEGDLRFTYLAPTFEEHFGLSASSVMESFALLMEHIDPQDRELIRQSIVVTSRDMSDWNEEFRIHHPIKGVVWIHGQSSPERQEDGSIIWYGYFHDVTERKNSEKRLMMIETAINSTTEAIYINDTSLRIIYVNDGACRMLGYSREELLAMRIIDIDAQFTPDEIHEFKASTLNEANIAFETRHRRKDGSIIDVEIVGTSFAYDNDEIILSVVKEITERKKMEKALRYREEYQRTLLDNFPYFVWLKDKESRLLAANIQYARVANVQSTADLVGKTDFDFFPHDLSTKYVTDDQSVMREGKSKNVEEHYADEYGNIRWMETWKSPVWVNQEIVGTVGCSRDITERKEMENALRESEARYREIFDNTSDALYLLEVTPEGRYKNIAFNRAFETSTGIDKTELIGKYVDDFPDSESVRQSILKYDRCVRLGEPIEESAELNLPSGRKIYRSILIPIKNEEGRVVRIIGLAREER